MVAFISSQFGIGLQVRCKGRNVSETLRRRKDAEEWALDIERRIDRGEELSALKPCNQDFQQKKRCGNRASHGARNLSHLASRYRIFSEHTMPQYAPRMDHLWFLATHMLRENIHKMLIFLFILNPSLRDAESLHVQSVLSFFLPLFGLVHLFSLLHFFCFCSISLETQ